MSLIRLPKHYKETVISKPNAIANGLANAAQTATKFITDISGSGIWVTPDGAQPSESGSALPTTTGWHISDAIELFRQGSSYFKIWLENSVTKVRVGLESSGHALFTPNGMDIFNGGESVAEFGGNGTRIGKATGESHILQDYHSLQMVDKEGNPYFKIEDLCDESGTLEVTDTFESDGESKVYVLTYTATGTDYTVTVSDDSGGSVQKQTTKITFNTYPTVGAVITVTYTTASELTKSYTFGKRKANADVGAMSVADGLDTAASGRQSHASGYLTTASGSNSYAGGARTTAAGRNSRATGEDTTANGWGSNADGLQTIAGYNYQTVIGKWNENHYNSAFEIGNGVTGARSNAFVVDWDGTVTAAGELFGAATAEDMAINSAASAVTTRSARRAAGIVTLHVVGLKLASALANNAASGIVLTVPDGFRPSETAYAQVVTSGHDLGSTYARIGTDGAVTIRNQSGASIPTTYSLAFTLTYVR